MENEQYTNSNLVSLISQEFIKRCKKNPSYSLRAYARFLGIDQSLLSRILKGSSQLGKKSSARIGLKLGLKPIELDFIESKTSNATQPLDSKLLANDEFELISDWYHFAILELAKLKNFNPDEQAIAKKLGLHIQEVRAACERLERVGYIKRESIGGEIKWTILSPNNSWIDPQATSEAKRKLQKSLLEQSLIAIDSVPLDLRQHGSLTIAVNVNQLNEMKDYLRKIRDEFEAKFQAKSADAVYQLQVSLFPVTKNEEGKKNEEG